MYLKDFISSTLVEIAEGIKEAQVHYKEFGGAVNPSGISAPINGLYYSIADKRIGHTEDFNFYLSNVNFEIGLADSNTHESKQGIGVLLSAVGIGANTNQQEGNVSITKIRFSVPVKLPTQYLK